MRRFVLALALVFVMIPATASAGEDEPLSGLLEGYVDTQTMPPSYGVIDGFLFWNKGISGIEAFFLVSPGFSTTYAGPQLNLEAGPAAIHLAGFVGVEDFQGKLLPRYAAEASLNVSKFRFYGVFEHDFADAGYWYTGSATRSVALFDFGLRARSLAGWGPLAAVNGSVGGLPFQFWLHWAPNGPERLETFTPEKFQLGAIIFM